ncbi:MAG: hypothetical protein C0391_05395 [Anaerolinea sp.]|nr:hypothetical protein [Anaerolinea sp.]
MIREKIVDIIFHLENSITSGIMALVVINTLREKYSQSKETTEDIFISSLFIGSYNTLILCLSNFIKHNKESINLIFLFTGIKEENPGLEASEYSNLLVLIEEFETALDSLHTTLDAVIKIRDTTIAHIDKKHVNNPNALLVPNNPLWDDLSNAYSLIGSGLDEVGKYFGLVPVLDFVTLANVDLADKTKRVFDFLYFTSSVSTQARTEVIT